MSSALDDIRAKMMCHFKRARRMAMPFDLFADLWEQKKVLAELEEVLLKIGEIEERKAVL